MYFTYQYRLERTDSSLRVCLFAVQVEMAWILSNFASLNQWLNPRGHPFYTTLYMDRLPFMMTWCRCSSSIQQILQKFQGMRTTLSAIVRLFATYRKKSLYLPFKVSLKLGNLQNKLMLSKNEYKHFESVSHERLKVIWYLIKTGTILNFFPKI